MTACLLLRRLGVAALICCVVQFGPATFAQQAMTPAERVHSTHFPEYKSGHKIADLASQGTGDVVIYKTVRPESPAGVPGEASYPNPYLRWVASRADLLVIGTVQGKNSHLMSHGEFLFTDLQIVVERVGKDNGRAVTPGEVITITRAGGDMKLNGRDVHAVDLAFFPFQVGDRYILFGKLIPETGAFKVNAEGSFRVLPDGRVVSMMRNPLYRDMSSAQNSETFWAEALSAAQATSQGGQR